MKTDLEKGIELAIQACRKLVEANEDVGCCDLCGGWGDEHFDGCPFLDAKRALQLLGIKE